MTRFGKFGLAGLALAAVAAWFVLAPRSTTDAAKPTTAAEPPPPSVSVAAAVRAPFVDNVLVTGSLVARTEVLVAPEVEGLRIVALAAEEGDMVKRDQLLARLEQETVAAQLAQNAAALARATAAIAQANSQIAAADARMEEARASYERAQPLKKSGVVSEAVFDQRQAAARSAEAQLAAARDGLKLAEAERAQIEAQRRELTWRSSRTEIRAPVDGLVTRRTARIGGVASAAGEPMFRLATSGEIELDAEVPEAAIGRLTVGQKARISVAGAGEVEGRVRLVSPEVDKSTRLGRVRIHLGSDPRLRIGAFGRGVVEIERRDNLAIPASAVMFSPEGAEALVVRGDTVTTVRLTVGLNDAGRVEVLDGLKEGDVVVAKASTFLRSGDRVRPISAAATPKMSEVR